MKRVIGLVAVLCMLLGFGVQSASAALPDAVALVQFGAVNRTVVGTFTCVLEDDWRDYYYKVDRIIYVNGAVKWNDSINLADTDYYSGSYTYTHNAEFLPGDWINSKTICYIKRVVGGTTSYPTPKEDFSDNDGYDASLLAGWDWNGAGTVTARCIYETGNEDVNWRVRLSVYRNYYTHLGTWYTSTLQESTDGMISQGFETLEVWDEGDELQVDCFLQKDYNGGSFNLDKAYAWDLWPDW